MAVLHCLNINVVTLLFFLYLALTMARRHTSTEAAIAANAAKMSEKSKKPVEAATATGSQQSSSSKPKR